jgi:hypothetical protein
MASGPLALCPSRVTRAEPSMSSSTGSIASPRPLHFNKLFAIFESRIDLFGKDTDNPKIPEHELRNAQTIRSYILDGARNIPGLYYEPYIAPLLNALELVLSPRNSVGTIEALTGAVYDHRSRSTVVQDVRSFVALISNVYRSFVIPEKPPSSHFPIPVTTIPPLATFRPETDPYHRTPFTLHVTEVRRLSGGSVAVVSLPSVYRKHPVLCWAAIAHEVGGHDILDAYWGLLGEIQDGVRQLFYKGSDPASGSIESDDQFLGLIWQYWAEESACDVLALMNVGPAYVYGLIVYFAALNDHYRGRQGVPRLRAQTRGALYNSTAIPVDYHPLDILKLQILVGAIEKLDLDKNVKEQYGQQIRQIATEWCPDAEVVIKGRLQLKPGRSFPVEKTLKRAVMEDHAYRVGQFIASAKFEAFHGHSIQDLETWDRADHYGMIEVREKFLVNGELSDLVDDAQLLSGAIEALCYDPDLYDEVNSQLSRALARSSDSDPIWATRVPWHP